jgi:ankyrin repeat protein/transglutaminase-like putative cysteine protease
VHKGVIYRNPRVYNVDYSFELRPKPDKSDRAKDLRLWIPIPREWDSQKAVKIISVEPEPHGRYVDPEYGNPMLFWDFSNEPEKPSYKVNLRFRSEQYDVHSTIDPNLIGPYDKTSKDYILYTRNTNTVTITDKVKELAETAVGNEKNAYLQVKRIYQLVREKMCYKGFEVQGKVRSVESILDSPVIDPKTGRERYLGVCNDQSMVFIALCRAVGIPARSVIALWDNRPWIRVTRENPEPGAFRNRMIDGLSVSNRTAGHVWAEVYLPNYGWVPVDPTFGRVGCSNVNNKAVIITKGRDIRIDPHAVREGNGEYRETGTRLHDGRAELLFTAVFHTHTIKSVKCGHLLYADPFPADALAEYMTKLYPETEAEKNLALYRKRTLRWIDQNTREDTNKTEALTQAYKNEPRARYEHEAFICHMLRNVVGDKKFTDIVATYTDLRVKTGEPVSSVHFQKIAGDVYGQPLDWFFNQWVGYTELPQLQLSGITFSQDEKGWHVRGRLRQLNKLLFRLPVELVIETEKTTEHKMLWVDERDTEFEFLTGDKPQDILVDPNNEILSIRDMPPLLESPSYDEIAFCVITNQDQADWYDWTPLHFAAHAGQINVVEYLIAAGADIEAENIKGETPLQLASNRGHREITELLRAKVSETSIHGAARLGALDKVKAFLEKGVDVNAKDAEGMTPLHLAAYGGHREIVEFLLSQGADVHAKDNDGRTPLDVALSKRRKDVLKLLAEAGADIATIHMAAFVGSLGKLRSFVQTGTDVDARDENGRTPLLRAITGKHVDAVKFLIEAGADLNRRDEQGYVPLVHALWTPDSDVVKLLLNNEADVHAKDTSGYTPLHWAVMMGSKELTKLMLEAGADVSAESTTGETPVDLARQGSSEIVELLRKHMLPRDVAITSLSVPPTCVQGDILPVTVSVANEGDQRGAFRVILFDAVSNVELAGREMILEPQKYRSAHAADKIFTGDPNSRLGQTITLGKDINGDGYDDMIIGAPRFKKDKGRVYVYCGGENPTFGAPDLTLTGEDIDSRFGHTIEMADFNNDNYADVAIGAPGYNFWQGRAYIYYGGPDFDATADKVFDGERGTTGAFGKVAAGDMNNDGCADLLVSALWFDSKRGRAYLFYGAPGRHMDTVCDLTFDGENPNDEFGRPPPAVGDVDGDHCDDVIIGTRDYPSGKEHGRAYLYYGAEGTSMDNICDLTFNHQTPNDEFATIVDIFDIDSDGFGDIIITARRSDHYRGQVYLYWGSDRKSMDTTYDKCFTGEDNAPMLGSVTCGDVNNDGYGDLLLGGLNYPNGNLKGRAYLYYGNTKGLVDTTCDLTFSGENDADRFGFGSAIGDINGDNFADVLIGARTFKSNSFQGRAYLYYGPFSDTEDITFNWDTTAATPGKHTLRATIAPVEGEEDVADNTMIVEVEVKERPGSVSKE